MSFSYRVWVWVWRSGRLVTSRGRVFATFGHVIARAVARTYVGPRFVETLIHYVNWKHNRNGLRVCVVFKPRAECNFCWDVLSHELVYSALNFKWISFTFLDVKQAKYYNYGVMH